jgi:methyl-accepting chemotaxis protein
MNLITKMVSLALTLITCMSVIVGMAYYNMSQMSNTLSVIGGVDIPLSNSMATVMSGQLSQSAWLERSILAAELEITEDLNTAVVQFDKEHQKIDTAIQVGLATVTGVRSGELSSEEFRALQDLQASIRSVRRDYDTYYEHGSELLTFIQAGDITNADSVLKKVQVLSAELAMLIDPLNKKVSSGAQLSAQGLVLSSQNALTVLGIIGFFAIILSIALSILITRSLLRQLGADPAELERVAEQLAEGKLDVDSQAQSHGVAASINTTVSKLQEVISSIKNSAIEMSVASAQVGQGNANLSQRTQEQASSLEEIAASMEEMTNTVGKNADNAIQANKLALEASKQAEDGGSIAGRAVTAMYEINDSSKEISEIISVIDDIAFQINLLALNAAVEAARAGDQGRGFAVVAAEVRNLAGRSATAAKEIKELIRNSVSKIDSGTELVGETGNRLTEIVESIKKVSDNVGEIAAASREQSEGIIQVNRAILEMDDMTQQNASLVEQAAAASETVDNQAGELLQLISFFQVGDHGGKSSTSRPFARQTRDFDSVSDDRLRGLGRRKTQEASNSRKALQPDNSRPYSLSQDTQRHESITSAEEEWERF